MKRRFTKSGDARAVITGASRGIGLEIARELAPRVRSLELVARDRAALMEARTELLRDHPALEIDVAVHDLSSRESTDELAARLRTSPVDILVNNAGAGSGGAFWSRDASDSRRIIELNVESLVVLCHAIVPGLLDRGRGRILNVGSVAGEQPCPFLAVYGATKSFVNDFSRALDHELRSETRGGGDVRAGALLPGSTRTDFFDRAGIDVSKLPKLFEDPKSVARVAVEQIEEGSPWRVSGWRNRIGIELQRIAPRNLVTKIAGSFFDEK